MTRTIAIALAFGMIGSAAFAAPPNQLVGPKFNPGLKTVPFVPSSQDATANGTCDQQLVSRIDSGTVIAGPDGLVAHLTGMAIGVAGGAQLVVTSTDGITANADFTACRSTVIVDSPSPVATSLNLPQGSALQSIIVHAEANSMVLYTSKAH